MIKHRNKNRVATTLSGVLIVVAQLFAPVVAHAAQPLPPCLEGGNCGPDPYNLGAVPFTYSWPASPNTNRTINVSTIGQFQSAVGQSGARVIVAAGTYSGGLNVTGSDLDIVISNQATIRGTLTFGDGFASNRPSRIRWTGGNLNGGLLMQPLQDLLVNDFNVDNQASGTPEGIHNMTGISGSQPQGWSRVAWINSTLTLRGSESSGGWAWYMGDAGQNNLILANVKMISQGGQNNRFQGITNLIIVDSVFNPDGQSSNGMRLHHSNRNVYIRDSWSRGLMKMDEVNTSDGGPSVINATFDNYDRYYNSYAFQGSHANTGVVRNSTLFGGSAFSVSPLQNGGGNSAASWDGSTVPDYSRVGALR